MISATNTFDGTYVTYKYDYQGRMFEKNVSHGGTETRRDFVWNGNRIVSELITNNSQLTTNLYCWAGGETLTASLDGETVFYCHDANKNVTDLVDADGDSAAHYEYSPFGVITDQKYTLAEANPFRFSNEYFDSITGQVEYEFRKYLPSLGKFMSRDPIGIQGGPNEYGICGNDLINHWDLWGWFSHQHCCSPEQISTLRKAEKESLRRLKLWQNYLSDIDLIWMTIYVSDYKNSLPQAFEVQRLWNFKKAFSDQINVLSNAIQDNEYGVECESRCKEGKVAYVIKNWLAMGFDDDIHFCPIYFDKSWNDQNAYFTHELSHYYLGTIDAPRYEWLFQQHSACDNLKYAQFFEEVGRDVSKEIDVGISFERWLKIELERGTR